MLLDEVADPEQQRLPLIGLPFAPRSFERGPRRGDGAVDVLPVALGDIRQQFAGRGVAAFESLA
jgi:hypothetical protein